jgi:hypothetical protein
MKGTIAWRLRECERNNAGSVLIYIPALALQVVPPALVFIGCFFIPESPRWLASCDRIEEATALIYKYHGGPDNEVAKLEIREIVTHIKNTKPQTPSDYIRGLWDYRELFSSHSARWRTGMITLITLSSQFAGNTILTCNVLYAKYSFLC